VKAHVTFKREAVFFPCKGKNQNLSTPKEYSSHGLRLPLRRHFVAEREREKLRDFVDDLFVRSVYTSAAGTQNRRCLFETFLLLNGDVNTNTIIILIIIVFEGVVHVEKKTAKNIREKNEQRDDVGAHDERYGC
jgi:hypothetical protein